MNLLVVEDDPDIASFARFVAERAGHKVFGCPDFPCVVQVVERVDAALLDYELGGEMNGLEIAKAILERRPNLPIAFATARVESRTDQAIRRIADRILIKPFEVSSLQSVISSLNDAVSQQ